MPKLSDETSSEHSHLIESYDNGTSLRSRRSLHHPSIEERRQYVYPELHDNLAEAIERDPLAIREDLQSALGANGEPTWLPTLNRRELTMVYSPKFEYSRNHDIEQAAITSDIPMITLNASEPGTAVKSVPVLTLDTGIPKIPVHSPIIQSPNLKLGEAISRLSERVMGGGAPKSPTHESPNPFSDLASAGLTLSIFPESADRVYTSQALTTGQWTSHSNLSAGSIQGSTESIARGGSATGHMENFIYPNTLPNELGTIGSMSSRPPRLAWNAESGSANTANFHLYGKSLGIFSADSKTRRWCHQVASSSQAKFATLGLLVLQVTLLTYRQWNPRALGGYVVKGYNWADYLLMAINIIYTFESAVKIIAYGLIDDEAMLSALDIEHTDREFSIVVYLKNKVLSSVLWWFPALRKKVKRRRASSAKLLFEEILTHSSPPENPFADSGGGRAYEDSDAASLFQRRYHGNPSLLSVNAPPQRFGTYDTFLQANLVNKRLDEMNLQCAYLRDNWHRIDFISVICFWISLLLSIDHYDAKHHFLIFRALSCLRILRLCNLTTGTNVIIRACHAALPMLVDISLCIVCFWTVFAIIGVQSFKSSLTRHCVWTNPLDSTETYTSEQYCGSYIGLDNLAKAYIERDGSSSGRIKGYRCPMYSQCVSGENPYNGTVNFDNFFQSMQLVFVVISVNAFSELMYYLMDTDDIASSLFFVFGILIMTLWLVNIFVSVIVTSFNVVRMESRVRAEDTKRAPIFSAWVFDDELHSVKVREFIRRRKLLRMYYRFEFLFIIVICASLVIQCIRSDNMSDNEAHFLYRCEAVFTGVLALEILIRLVLYLPDWRTFFISRRNCFDLVLAVMTGIIIIGPVKKKLGHVYYWLTIFQVARFYRVVLSFRITSELWHKVVGHAKAIFDLTLFYFVTLFLFSILGARLFEDQVPEDLVDDVEFAMHTLPNAIMTLYVVTSTENWADIMYHLQLFTISTVQRAVTSMTIIIWFAISNFIIINIFIAIIASSLEISEEGRRKHQLRQFIEDMTLKLQSVRQRPGWLDRIRNGLFKRKEDANLEKAVTNLLLSGSAVNEFLERDEDESDQDSDRDEQTIKARWYLRLLRHARLQNFLDNPFYAKKKRMPVVTENFEPTAFATQVLNERRNLVKEQDRYLRENPMYNTVFYMMEPKHKLREWCQKIVPSSHGERIDGTEPNKRVSDIFAFLMFLATVGIVVMACFLTPIYRTTVHLDEGQWSWPSYLDITFMSIFTIEFLIKITADGLFFTPNAYVRSPWNWLDFMALASLWVEFIAFLKNDGDLSRIVRGMKALRAFRILTISQTAKDNFHYTMISGFGKIMSAALISVSLIFPFSIWGLNIFNGQLGYCLDGLSSMADCNNEYSNQVFDWDIMSPRTYVQPYLEFDRFTSSFSSLYQIVSLEGWTDLLINVMQSRGKGVPQEMFASPFNGFYVMFFNIVSVVFILTLFVSVIINNYAQTTGRAYLTNNQIQWYHVKRFLLQVDPSKRLNFERNTGIRGFCHRMAVEKNRVWGSTLNLVLFLHLVMLLIEAWPEARGIAIARYIVFMISSFCFSMQSIMLLVARGFKDFARNKWNIYAIVVAFGSFGLTFISFFISSTSVYYNFNKLFLLAMLSFLLPRSDRLIQLMRFASASLPSLISLLFTWFVIFLVYAIAMNQIFGLTKVGPNSSGNINARSVPKALILLFRCSLGEGWNYIMDDFTVEAPFCSVSPEAGDSDCGNKQYAYLLFMSWNIISMYIMLNLFVSLIVDSFSYMNQGSRYAHLITRGEIRKFKEKWLAFDPEGTGFIDPKDLQKFLSTLDGSLSFHMHLRMWSIPVLCQRWIRRNDLDDPYNVSLNYGEIDRIMLAIDLPKIQQRRRLYEMFVEEAKLTMELHEEPGILFKRLIVQIPLYKSFDFSECLVLIDYLERRLLLRKLDTRMKKKRFEELVEGCACRWLFKKHKQGVNREEQLSGGNNIANQEPYTL